MPCNCRHGTGPHDHMTSGIDSRDGLFGVGVPLNGYIDRSSVACWNSKQSNRDVYEIALSSSPPAEGSGAGPFVSSDADEEFLVHIPFQEIVRVRGIVIQGTCDGYSPSTARLFVNRTDVRGFDSVRQAEPQEVITLANTSFEDQVIYRIHPIKFQQVSGITVLFPNSIGGEDETHFCRIEFFGESTSQPVNRPLATNVVYESMANPADHKIIEEGRKGSQLIQ